MRNLLAHKHKCSNGHIWEHEANISRMTDPELNKADHTCQVCGEVQFTREADIERTLDRVQALVIAFLEGGSKAVPDAQTGEILTALSLVASMASAASKVMTGLDGDNRDALKKSWEDAFGNIPGFPNPFSEEVNKQ